MPGVRQTRHPPTGIGLGVDRTGGPVIDPTENVLALVDVQKTHQMALAEAERRYQNDMREAETRRINELRAQDARYATIMESMRNDKIDSTAKLLADQLQEIKSDIQVELRSLNQFRWESGARTSVSDPAIAEALKEMTTTVRGLTKAEDKSAGRGETVAWGITVLMAVVALAGIIVAILNYAK